MKRLIALLLAVLMLFSLMACGKKNQQAPADDSAAPADEAPAETPAASSGSGKTAGEEAAEAAAAAGTDSSSEPQVVTDENGVSMTVFSSLDELNNVLGGKVKKPVSVDVADEAMWLVNDNGVDIEQYMFSISGITCGVRFSPDFKADIGGMKDENGVSIFEGQEEECTLEYGDSEVGRWVTVDGQYILVVKSNELQLFDPLLQELKILSSGDDLIIIDEAELEEEAE